MNDQKYRLRPSPSGYFSLGGRRDALSRQIVVCFREPGKGHEPASGLAHRIEEAGALLRGIGVRLVRQEGAEISALPTREILWLLDERDRRKQRDERREKRGLVERRLSRLG